MRWAFALVVLVGCDEPSTNPPPQSPRQPTVGESIQQGVKNLNDAQFGPSGAGQKCLDDAGCLQGFVCVQANNQPGGFGVCAKAR